MSIPLSQAKSGKSFEVEVLNYSDLKLFGCREKSKITVLRKTLFGSCLQIVIGNSIFCIGKKEASMILVNEL